MSRAIFRVDAGPAEGLGHLQRCLVLATHLRNEGWDVAFICARAGADISPRLAGMTVYDLAELGPAASPLDERADAEATLRMAGRATDDAWAIVDHYELGELWERMLSAAGYKVAVIDDFRNRRHYADLLIGDAPEPFEPSLNSAQGEAPALSGPAYSLISVDPSTAVSAQGDLRRILITYGSTDPTGETTKALGALDFLIEAGALPNGIHADVVVGYHNADRTSLIERSESAAWLKLHFAPLSLAPFLADADLVLTAGGNTMAEALVLHQPLDHQPLVFERLVQDALIVAAGEADSVDQEKLAQAVRNAAASLPQLRQRLAGRNPFDGRAAQRIAVAMAVRPSRPSRPQPADAPMESRA
jgi:spore coat polysaccharide biosynthesis predicted glycosyltransferase SpsG